VVKHVVYLGQFLLDLEDIDLALFSEDEEPLPCERSLTQTGLPWKLLAQLDKALTVLLIDLFNLN
jgi:hypothetical protein